MEFKPLYKLNKNGRWQQYLIKVFTDNNDKVFIEKSFGLINGKMRTNKEEIKQVKSQDTKLNQAIFMAKRIWLNKIQTDLFKEIMEDEKSDFSIEKDFRPQLAKTYDIDKTKLIFPISAQKKYDGNRAILYRDKNDNIVMDTRNGHRYLDESVQFITSEYKDLPKNIILDGELYIPNMSFQELQSIVRLKKKPNCNKLNDFKRLKFYTFDIIYLDEPNLIFSDRYNRLEKIVSDKNNTILVENDVINSKEDIKTFHDKYIEEGYEGIILRNMNKKYGINKRNGDLLKYKYFVDSEYKIIGMKIEINNEIEYPMWICETEQGKQFTCRPTGTNEYKINLLKNYKKYLGKLLTVKYQELSDDGIPRFGIGKSIREFM